MISKNNLKYIKSLQIKKIRKEQGLFLVEGAKSILELLSSDFSIVSIFLTSEFYKCYKPSINDKIEIHVCSESELNTAGTMVNNNAAIAISRVLPNIELPPLTGNYTIVLDDIKDPGNLGTIIRIADWYGINQIICSANTAEFYNPKVIASTMGSFTRVKHYYCDINNYLEKYKSYVYGASLTGQNLHEVTFKKEGILLIGNESIGINRSLESFINQTILIPRFGKAESLNAAVATGIILDNIKRSIN